MKAEFALCLLGLAAAGCAPSAVPGCPDPDHTLAVYLAAPEPALAPDQTARHPEICPVDSFADLRRLAVSPVVLWIDAQAAEQVEVEWLETPPQRYDPIILIGYGTALYALRDHLGLSIGGPAADWAADPPEPGFSVWVIEDETPSSLQATLRGYPEPPEVDRLVEVSRDLLSRAFRSPAPASGP